MKVFRCFSEKKKGFDVEAQSLLNELRTILGVSELESVRYFCRYDVQGITEEVYAKAKTIVFSEPQCDDIYDEDMPSVSGRILAIEPLPGQYDQRSDSAAQCIQLMTTGERPLASAAKVYVFSGNISDSDFDKIAAYLINPVDSRQASLDKKSDIEAHYEIPTTVNTVDGFIVMDDTALLNMQKSLGLAMDLGDLEFLQNYFKNDEKRDPTITEIRVIDTYWSDHCRHTTFLTTITAPQIEDEAVSEAFSEYINSKVMVYGEEKASKRPMTLMDVATMGTKALKREGYLSNLDESEEINACSIKIDVKVGDKTEPWLLMFKNETHNHPTEIEPFGGAATCLGGAIRDPLSGRSYVYQAMRVTGAADPTVSLADTMEGKLSQRQICRTAAAGYSSYGNQIGLATGLVNEIYHPNYVAKRMEIGAVVGAVPYENVVREVPEPGDIVILLGGRTGRDGCGGATGSSKSHTVESIDECSAEVQKGNPPEERKIQRLFRNGEVTRMIRRCNDFGAGGVSVAIGELADGLEINLDLVPKKYAGLDGTELAISESQERMAVVIHAENRDKFIAFANAENIEAIHVATVTEEKRLKMMWNGKDIVNISRAFLDTNGVSKETTAIIPKMEEADFSVAFTGESTKEKVLNLMSDLNVCLQKGLNQRFDSSIGASSVLLPFGGKNQLTPAQAMAAKIPTLEHGCTTASVMAYGFDAYLSSQNTFVGAQCAVIDSVAKLVATGADYTKSYLTLQEYFERLGKDPMRFGKPLSSVLGAFYAQRKLKIAAIGGKDSMSGTFGDIDVPPTLVSFAIAPMETDEIITAEFKKAGNNIYCFDAMYNIDKTPNYEAIASMWSQITNYIREGKIVSAYAIGFGGISEAIAKMAIGNDIGFKSAYAFDSMALMFKNYGGLIVEANCDLNEGWLIGTTTEEATVIFEDTVITLDEIKENLNKTLESVYPSIAKASGEATNITSTKSKIYTSNIIGKKPLAVIPVFPGTNCEYDTKKAIERAGGEAEIIVIANQNHASLEASAERLEKAILKSQMMILPGGFSGGDEPDGSGKFIASFLRNPNIKDAVHTLLGKNDGLMLGICNGFQALIKLGLVPYGEIRDLDDNSPTLTFNLIGRHQSMYVDTRVCANSSPWLSKCNVGDTHTIAVSHGEGRFVASEDEIKRLIDNGQVAFQYADFDGNASMDIAFNPNGSMMAIEGITSPDGRVLGKMGHSERYDNDIAQNIYGNKYQPLFEGGVSYFK